MKIKLMKVTFVAALMACMLAGCSSYETTAEYADQEEKQSEEKKDNNADASIIDKIPRITKVGSDVNGYIDLTEGEWVQFKEAGGFNDESVIAADQATTVTNSAIITMITYDMDADLDNMAKNAMEYCESNGAENVQGARGVIGKYDCTKVYCVYPDYGRFLFSYYFKADDGYTHYIAAEFSGDDTYVSDLVDKYYKE